MSDIIPSLIVMCICVVMSAYFSATETAFSSLNKTRLRALAENGNKRAELAYRLSEKYDDLISTILIGNNIVNITLASLGTLVFIRFFPQNGATLSTVVITIVVLIFGEITPKSIAKDNPESFAMFSAPIIKFFIMILTPISFFFLQLKKLLAKMFKHEEQSAMSSEELLMIVDEVEQGGAIDTDESELIRNAIEFNELKAEDILTHRVDLEALADDTPKEEIAQAFTESRFSRLLVYNENIDNVIGVLHQKDFYVGSGVSPKPISELISPPLFIHKSENINELLKMLQREKSHIAVVIDDYGGTLGIVTMEDILEELVGEIWDEHDEVVENFKKIADDIYVVDGAMDFDDFRTFFDFEYDTDSVSLSGWITEQTGKIPANGDQFTFENLHISVTETDSHRVSKAKVVRSPKAE